MATHARRRHCPFRGFEPWDDIAKGAPTASRPSRPQRDSISSTRSVYTYLATGCAAARHALLPARRQKGLAAYSALHSTAHGMGLPTLRTPPEIPRSQVPDSSAEAM